MRVTVIWWHLCVIEKHRSNLVMSIETPTSVDNLRAFTASGSKPPSLDELIHALSSVLRIREPAPIQSYAWIPNLQKKHLSLLDAVALLLVVDKTDAVAVSFLEDRTSIEFYFARNCLCTTDITEYIESLLEEVRNYKSSEKIKFVRNLIRKVASMCLKKIRNRIWKVSVELANSGIQLEMLSDDESINNIGIWQLTGAPEGATAKAFAKAYLRSPLKAEQFNQCDKTLLVLYFRFALRMNISIEELRSNPCGVLELLTLSYHIGCALNKDPILNNTALIHRIQRLGDYYGAVRTIARALEVPVMLGKEIRFIEVSLSPFHLNLSQ